MEITSTGWQVVTDPPVKFRRARGMLALPTPIGGGDLVELLRPFLNFATEDDLRLMVAWLVMRSARPARIRCWRFTASRARGRARPQRCCGAWSIRTRPCSGRLRGTSGIS